MTLDPSVGLLVLRLVVGGIMMAHGAQKVLGSFNGPGPAGMVGMMQNMGLKPARLWAIAASWAEFGGGILLILGFLTPLGGIAVASGMVMAILLVHFKNGFWASKGGYEMNLLILAAAVSLVFTGPGRHSFDYGLGVHLSGWFVLLVALAAVLSILYGYFMRGKSPAAPKPN